MEEVSTLISTFGFPIVCCLILMYYVFKLNETHKQEINEIMKEHKDEVNKMTEAINSNTLVMTKLLERLGEKDGI